jgi:hypothetical protein
LHAKARARNGGVAEFSCGQTTIGKEGLDWKSMKVRKIFSEEGCSLELAEDLEA